MDNKTVEAHYEALIDGCAALPVEDAILAFKDLLLDQSFRNYVVCKSKTWVAWCRTEGVLDAVERLSKQKTHSPDTNRACVRINWRDGSLNEYGIVVSKDSELVVKRVSGVDLLLDSDVFWLEPITRQEYAEATNETAHVFE